MTTYHTAIIGPEDVVSGFRALGVSVIPATSGDELLSGLQTARKGTATGDRYAVVLVIESLVRDVPEDVWAKATEGVLPAVTVLPGLEGSHGEGVRALKRLAERAIGSDILG